jgi:acid stress-induced BolA-like protein IbaG/YrbA
MTARVKSFNLYAMQPEEIKQLIEAGLPGAKALVTGDGYKFEAIVVSEAFEGLSMLKKQQMVYATVSEQIASGALHALTIKAYTPEEWRVLQGQ